jgi:hypothetical protein
VWPLVGAVVKQRLDSAARAATARQAKVSKAAAKTADKAQGVKQQQEQVVVPAESEEAEAVRMATMLEAEFEKTDGAALGLSTPALELIQYQREAQGCDALEVGICVADMVEHVCAVGEAGGQVRVEHALARGDDGRFCSVAQKREVVERVFGLQLRAQVQAVRPEWLMRRDDANFVRHVDNHRRNKVQYLNLQRPKDGYRPQQIRLLDARTKEDMESVIAQRRMEVISCLSPGYLRVRVAVIRTWVHFCVEVKGVSPWRMHWPQDAHDDELMADYLVSLSMRYTDFSVIEASKMHVIEFHRGYLRVPPPGFPLAKWELSKIKRLLAVEFPLGRKVRPGLDFEQVCKICAELMRLAQDANVCKTQRRLFANCGAAIAATYSPALRTGETCPGDGWNAREYWHRAWIAPMMDAHALARSGVEGVVLKVMKRKTVYMSAVARQKANNPVVYDAKATHAAAFAVWGPLLRQVDPCTTTEAPHTPAFRMGGPRSLPLSTSVLREVMRTVAEQTLGPDWSAFDYGMHSLRIGRENGLRAADLRPELINDITSHTSVRGRQPYSRADVAELVSASRKADAVVARPVEKAIASGSDGSVAVYVGGDGAVVDRISGVAPVNGGERQYGAVSASVQGASARQKRASGQTSITDAFPKRTRS